MFKLNWVNTLGWDLGYLFPPKRKTVNLLVNSTLDATLSADLNISVVTEPDEAVPGVHEFAIKNWKKYDYVVSCFDDILEQCPNARKMVFFVPWITQEFPIWEKKFDVTFLCGWKSWTSGHKLRHEVYRNQNKISIPRRFFISTPYDQTSRYDSLFKEYQFNLAIENCSRNNFFTEKLLDCFLTKTIPIYWGCPNIGDFFNKEGMILFGEMDTFYDRVNSLTPDYYNQHLDSVIDNYNRAKEMTKDIGECGYKIIDRKVDELLEEKFGPEEITE